MLKTIAGHTSARGIYRYLTRKNRALASDYINIDAPNLAHPEMSFDWARVMDSTRRAFGNDLPWRGKRVRTYKHYVVSPNPKDGIGLEALRELATAWAAGHFSEYEVAIVYHDDNARGIPHAHVVVNNTNIETGRRLQDPDPKALAASLQDIAERQGLSALRAPEPAGVAARAQRCNPKKAPETYRSEYVRSAEKELAERGEYSWTADIRARVRIARTVARSEAEFKSALSSMGVTVTDNSPRAQRRDWIYALADHPSRRISGERMGLSYGREQIELTFLFSSSREFAAGKNPSIVAAIENAITIKSLEELQDLATAITFIESFRIRCNRDLKSYLENADDERIRETIQFIYRNNLLPDHLSSSSSQLNPVGRTGSLTDFSQHSQLSPRRDQRASGPTKTLEEHLR